MLRQEVLRGKSPTDELLVLWGQQNHTVLELFILLSRMKHYQGMMLIKEYVPTPYHKLIKRAQDNIHRLLEDLNLENAIQEKDNRIPKNNLNQVENKPSLNTKNVQLFLTPAPLKIVIPPSDAANCQTRDVNESVDRNNRFLKPVSPQVSYYVLCCKV